MKLKWWQFSFIAVSSFSCVATSQALEEAVGLRAARWDITTIPVCWENPAAANLSSRGWVEAAVERTWEAHSALRFSGWGQCENNSSGIRIQIRDGWPSVQALGQLLNGMENGMVLNFGFNNWSPGCRQRLQFCIEVIAVHEFGHAIGLAHEQNRADAPVECQQERQGTDGDTFLTPYDLNSVMNYCNPNWNGDGQLSPMDVAGVQRWYPANFNFGPDGILSIEAESANLQGLFPPFEVISNISASSGEYIVWPHAGSHQQIGLPNEQTQGQARYTFNLNQTASIEFSIRMRTPDGDKDDSFYYRIDDGAWNTQNGWQTHGWGTVGAGEWKSRIINTFTDLPEGEHTLSIVRRENGTEIDTITLTIR